MRIRRKLYQDDQGNPQVCIVTVNDDPDYWREDGQLNFLEAMADDPDSSLTKVREGVYQISKF